MLWTQLYMCSVAGTSTAGDLDGLRALYDSLQGPAWKFPGESQIWNFNAPDRDYCQWSGVHCCPAPGDAQQAVRLPDPGLALLCNKTGSVVALELQEMGLRGELPTWDEISALQSLAVLNVSLNEGELPTDILVSRDTANILLRCITL